ncbi:MAG: hypothetical protein QME79_07715 [Bacillota bacterium]|nr:hypothetical protein [Bacillota bacterium]
MKIIEVKLRRCTLALTEAELLSLLAADMTLWRRALERGKALRRSRAKEARLGWAPGASAQPGREGRP